MTLITTVLTVISAGLWLLVASARGPSSEKPPSPALASRAVADRCGTDLHLLAALPSPPSGDAEAVWLRNGEPTPLPLHGFTLVAGRQRRPLPDLIAAPGEVIRVVPPRLRDRDGMVSLVDPCGVRLELSWDRATRGELVRSRFSEGADTWRPEEGPDIVLGEPHRVPLARRDASDDS